MFEITFTHGSSGPRQRCGLALGSSADDSRGGCTAGVIGRCEMKVAIACDHRGFEGKRRLLPVIKRMGHDVEDCGCDGTGSVDYPDYAIPVARQVAANQVDVGILLDGSGIGMSIVANKVPGVRAALAHDELTA